MKIERINENKIKVFLTLDDLQERNIDLTALTYNSPQTQKLFIDMMSIAEDEHNFFINDSQILIEALPVPPEGFEIIVTKVNDDNEFESIHKFIKNKLKKDQLSSNKKIKRVIPSLIIYQFFSFEDLCSGVCNMSDESYNDGTVYKYKDNYYLMFSKENSRDFSSKFIELNLNEFGDKISDTTLFAGFLEEHGEKIISDNAINIIKNYL